MPRLRRRRGRSAAVAPPRSSRRRWFRGSRDRAPPARDRPPPTPAAGPRATRCWCCSAPPGRRASAGRRARCWRTLQRALHRPCARARTSVSAPSGCGSGTCRLRSGRRAPCRRRRRSGSCRGERTGGSARSGRECRGGRGGSPPPRGDRGSLPPWARAPTGRSASGGRGRVDSWWGLRGVQQSVSDDPRGVGRGRQELCGSRARKNSTALPPMTLRISSSLKPASIMAPVRTASSEVSKRTWVAPS